jgi:hypothetical protein
LASASPIGHPPDVFIGYDVIGTTQGIAVFHNGTNVTSPLLAFPVGTPSRPDTLSAVFTFDNFLVTVPGPPVIVSAVPTTGATGLQRGRGADEPWLRSQELRPRTNRTMRRP